MSKYKLETWTRIKWKGTAREEKTTKQVLVKRDKKGRFTGKNPLIKELQTKTYAAGVYQVGIINGKIIARQKIAEKPQEWYKKKKEGIQKKPYRTSYVLNNIPISKKGYFGFRIVVFSTDKEKLRSLKQNMKIRLVRWIEECLRYSQDEFWFDMYFGYESPTICNANMNDNNKYFLTMENKYGSVLKDKEGNIREL